LTRAGELESERPELYDLVGAGAILFFLQSRSALKSCNGAGADIN